MFIYIYIYTYTYANANECSGFLEDGQKSDEFVDVPVFVRPCYLHLREAYEPQGRVGMVSQVVLASCLVVSGICLGGSRSHASSGRPHRQHEGFEGFPRSEGGVAVGCLALPCFGFVALRRFAFGCSRWQDEVGYVVYDARLKR